MRELLTLSEAEIDREERLRADQHRAQREIRREQTDPITGEIRIRATNPIHDPLAAHYVAWSIELEKQARNTTYRRCSKP